MASQTWVTFTCGQSGNMDKNAYRIGEECDRQANMRPGCEVEPHVSFEKRCLCSMYLVESLIGTGGGGNVYKAWHTRLNKHVVLKEHKLTHPDSKASAHNEAEALKNVKSMYIPQVFDLFEEEGRCFTVMEYVKGTSYEKALELKMEYTETDIARWYFQLASTLQTIHEKNICHCDIKPSNIMLTSSRDVCLIDFNSAMVEGSPFRVLSCSPGYASPEQLNLFKEHRQGVDASQSIDWKLSDIYSLGATMYHMLTRRSPLENAQRDENLNTSQQFNSVLASAIEKSMNPDPSDRFESAKQLLQTLAITKAKIA